MVNFPTSLDTFTDPLGTDDVSVVDHALQHRTHNAAVLALETKVGADASVDTNSLDYKISHLVPGGSDTQVQFNDNNTFGGDASFSWDKTTKTLAILGGGTTPVSQAIEGVYIGSDPNVNIAIVGPANGYSYLDFSVPNVDNDARIIVNHSAISLEFHIGQSDEGSMSFFAGGGIGMHSNLSVTGTVNGLSLSQANITTTSDNGLTIATGGVSSGTGTGTALVLTAGTGGSTSGDGGVLNINGGAVPVEGDGGDINVQLYPGATASSTSHRGGNFNVYLSGGVSGGAAGLFRISTPNQGYGGILNFSNLTADRIFSFPDVAGTVALISDIPSAVTAVSIATANGFSGSSTGGATPALTIVAGAITPTSVNGVVLSGASTPTLAVTGTTTVSGSNTGDQTSVSGNAGTATKWATARNLAGNSVDGSADVAFANNFIVQGTADTGLSAAQFLGALGTGILKNTTTTGVLSVAVSGTDIKTINGSSVLGSGNLVVTGTAPDIAMSMLAPTTGETITAGYGAVVPRSFKIALGQILTIGLAARFRIV